MRYVWIFLLFLNSAWAETFQITEISPHKVGDQEEWFEFLVTDFDEIDWSLYQISNGKNKPKTVSDLDLQEGDDGYFYFTKSPVSLANDGGVIQILDLDENILVESHYPKTKKGSTKEYEWAEIWNWDDLSSQLVPLVWRDDGDPNYAHTRGRANRKLPTADFSIMFSEANSDHDFLEFYVASGPDKINLKSLSFKHNGTTLWHFAEDFMISPGNFILVYLDDEGGQGIPGEREIHSNKRSGVSGGSGTVEVIAGAGTSLEKRLDFVCWKKDILSKTEQVRVDKAIIAKDWQGDCASIKDRVKNESIARSLETKDTNSKLDFFSHFNGSPGQPNETQNQPPQAVITLQGHKKVIGNGYLSVNVTGENSHDPDGTHDLATFIWHLDGEVFSEKSNPAQMRIETVGEHEIKLILSDHTGVTSEAVQTVVVLAPGAAPTTSQVRLSYLAEVTDTSEELKMEKTQDLLDNFFAPVLQNEAFMNSLENIPKSEEVAVFEKSDSPRRITLPVIVRQRLGRNLGLIWDWRVAPWAAGVGSISDGAIDQSSERFAVAFGVP